MNRLVTLVAFTGLVFVSACGSQEEAGMEETDQLDRSSEMMDGGSMSQDSMMDEGTSDEMMEEDGGMMEEDEMGGDGMGGGV